MAWSRPWSRALVPMVAALAFVGLVVVACLADRSPPLEWIRVTEVTPEDVELGEPLSITGDGFPSGQAARVTFRGTLYRPGEAPVRGAEIVASGTVVAPQRVDVPFGDDLEALFCRGGDRATHTTFEGDVEVAFRAASPGQPPVAGTLRHARLDVRPLTRPDDAVRARRGQDLLAFWGLHAIVGARQGGLRIDRVDPGSRAAAAGLAAGDALVRIDHLRVEATSDVLPAPDASDVTVALRRAGVAGELLRSMPVGGWQATQPAPLLASAFLVFAVLAIALAFGAPAPSFVDAALRPVLRRLRALAASRARAARSSGGAGPDLGAIRWLPPLGAPALAEGLAVSALALLPFGQYLVAARLDVGVFFVAATAVVAASALVAAGSASRGLRAALHVAWQHVPSAVALAGVVVVSGSLHVQEIERTQGGLPWEWLAFRSPASLFALLLFLAPLRVDPAAPLSGPGGLLALAEPPALASGARSPWIDAARRAHRMILCGLAAALFLGGWSLPGASPAQEDARPLLEVLGALVFSAKLVVLVAAAAWVQRTTPARWLSEGSVAAAPAQLALALAATAATAGWAVWAPARAVQAVTSPALVVAAGIMLVALGVRVRHGTRAPSADGRVSPFL